MSNLEKPNILIKSPRIVEDDGYYSYTLNTLDAFTFGGEILRSISEAGVNHLRYPALLDLCAGIGSVAAMLSACGWTDILCVDRVKVEGQKWDKWAYYDLSLLAVAIKRNLTIPSEITALRGTFDLVVAAQSTLTNREVAILCRYFARVNGVAIPDTYCPEVQKDKANWLMVAPIIYQRVA